MNNIGNKIKLLIFLLCIVALLSTINSTYSRYVSASSGIVQTDIARWQIFVNNENIVENYNTSMTFIPVIEQNDNVAANKIAPSSKGYFDIFINPSNVDVSFTYDINITIPNDSLISDIKVTDYAIVKGTEITEETTFTKIKLDSNFIKDTLLYDNETENFSFEPFIIRMYFAWIEGETETMNDDTDSYIGNMIANGEDTNFELGLNINFKQYVGEEDQEETPENQLPESPNHEEQEPNTDTPENNESNNPDINGEEEPDNTVVPDVINPEQPESSES